MRFCKSLRIIQSPQAKRDAYEKSSAICGKSSTRETGFSDGNSRRIPADARLEQAAMRSYLGMGNPAFRHGHSCRGKTTSEYTTYRTMLQRCYDPNHISYKHYGAKGVTVCDRWRKSFVDFLSDMGPKPAGYSIDRRDALGNYEPENCRWADADTQRRNRRDSTRFHAFGTSKTLGEWAEIFGLNYRMLWDRLDHNWDIERALVTPRRAYPR
jgi:hypothetical protein